MLEILLKKRKILKMKIYQILGLILFAAISFTACEEVIVLDLENADAQLVIEARVNATNQTASVFLTKSNGFYEDVNLNVVSDATVDLTLANGSIVNLPLIQNGFYAITGLNVVEGDALTMTVTDNDGNEYKAITNVPHTVEIDSLQLVPTNSGGPGGGGPFGGGNEQFFQIFTHWKDIGNKESFYQIQVTLNDTLQSDIYQLVDDTNLDGNALSRPIFQSFKEGDTVKMELMSIDAASFRYLNDLSAVQGQGFNSTTPYNPKSNFDNNALGYFGVVQVDEETVIL